MSSNWGRWGPEDERGAANLIDQPVVLRACTSVTRGTVYQLGIPVRDDGPATGGRRTPLHLMRVDGGDYAALDLDHGYADDYLMLATHGTSHVDALSHVWHDGLMYNGFAVTEVRSSGAARCGAEKIGALVTRAHLVSFASPDKSPRVIEASDLEAALGDAALPGDALLVHTGWMERWLETRDMAVRAPVLGESAAHWIAARDISVVGCDNPAVEEDGEDALHMILIRDHGVYLMELLSLAAPVGDAVRAGMLIVAPLQISRGVGSPVNPVLVV